MTKQSCVKMIRGFTLIESIIYVGLTAFLLIAVLGATYPILSGAERSSNKITADGETVFVVRKIGWAMGSVTGISLPNEGSTGAVLTLSHPAGTLSFTNANGAILLSIDGGSAQVLTASRAAFTNFSVTHIAPAGGASRAVDVQFEVNGNLVGPIRMYARY